MHEMPAYDAPFSSRFTGRTLAPIIGIIVAAFALALFFLHNVAAHEDEDARAQATCFLNVALANKAQDLRRTVQDNAAWGAAYENLHARFNIEWAYDQQNLSSPLFDRFSYEYVMVIGLCDPTALPTFAGGFADLIRKARAAPPDRTEVVTGTVIVDGDPVLVGAGAISTGDDQTVAAVPGPASIMVFGNRLTSLELDAMGQTVLTPGLRVVRGRPAKRSRASIVLPTVDGSQRAHLVWDQPAPGRTMLVAVIPWFALAALGVVAFAVIVIRNGARAAGVVGETTRRLAEAHELAKHQATHDPTTGLPNRAMLTTVLSNAFAAPQRELAVLFIDLDRFKPINDSLGHQAGDHVLSETAVRLKAAVADQTLVTRVGGDEFVVLLVDGAVAELERLASLLVTAIAAPIPYDGSEVFVGASIGIAQAPQDATTPDELLRKADLALYQAKHDGRGTYRFFDQKMNERTLERRKLELGLRVALERSEFFLKYQPRVKLEDLKIAACEALLRWQHPEKGAISPDVFIGLAEEAGLIVPIGAWVLRTACAEAVGWSTVSVSVNVSPAQFKHAAFVPLVEETLRDSGLAPGRLELEITEGVLLEDINQARDTMQALKALGVRLAIDDFGTGYSSLGYLRRFPFDTIKIDKEFILGLRETGDARAIVQAIVGLGHALGMSVTAEGVETPDQMALLRADKCEEAQGYLLSEPLRRDELTRLLGFIDATGAPREEQPPSLRALSA